MRLSRMQIAVAMRKVLKESGLDEPPINGMRLASFLNIEVRIEDFADSPILAMLFKGDKRSTVFLNERVYPKERQRFSLFHEIGHFVLHPKGSYMEILDAVENNIEWQANAAAAEAIMPAKWVKRLGPVYRWDPELLADRFRVSVQAMRIRLKELGLPILY